MSTSVSKVYSHKRITIFATAISNQQSCDLNFIYVEPIEQLFVTNWLGMEA